jgi:hypothetical protein
MLEVSKIIDLNPNTLKSYFTLGYLFPRRLASKPRVAARLDDKNINQLILFIHLLKLGYCRSVAANHTNQEKEFKNTVVVKDGSETILILKFKEIKARRLEYGRHDQWP